MRIARPASTTLKKIAGIAAIAVFVLTLSFNSAVPAHAQTQAAGTAAPAAANGATQLSYSGVGNGSTDSAPDEWCVLHVMGCIGYSIFSLANALLSLVALLFNLVIEKTVFSFGFLGGTAGIIAGWKVLRDVANIILLFGFIFIGIATMLDIHGYEAKKTLPRLIIIAVLLNFSLLISQGIIDTSNVFSSVLYSQATGCTGGTTNDNCSTNVGISGMIMGKSGAGSVFSGKNLEYSQGFIFFIALSIFAIILMVVLLAGTVLFLIRAIVLVFLMVLAPVGFAGMAIPTLEPYAQKWWSMLLSQSFFAPVFLLLIFVGLKISETLTSQSTLFDAIQNGNAGTVDVMIIFAIVVGFMIASLMAAKQMGAIGADMATNSASSLVFGTIARASNLAVGGGAYLARTSLQNSRFKDHAVARAVTNYGLRPLERANLDMRRIPGVGGALGVAGISAGAKPVEHATFGDLKHQYQDIRDGKKNRELNQTYDYERSSAVLEQEGHDNSGAPLSDKSKDFLLKRTTKELEEMHGIKAGSEKLVANLSPDQFEALIKSEKISEEERGNIRSARFASLAREVTAGNATGIKEGLKDMSKSDLENMPSALLLDPVLLKQLSDKQREDLGGSKKRSDAERQAIRGSSPQAQLEKDYQNAGGGAMGAAAVAGQINTLTVPQIAKLDKDILVQPMVAQQLTPAVLIELQEQKKLTPAQMTTIGGHIKAAGSSASAATKAYITTGPGAALWS